MKLLLSICFIFLLFLSPAQNTELYFWKKDSLESKLSRNDSLANPEYHITLQLELATFYVLQDWSKCVYYLERAQKLARSNSDKSLESRVLVSYGNKLAIHNDYPGSLRCYSEALRICQQYGRPPQLSGWLELNIGNLFYKLHTYSKASELYYDALLYFEKDHLEDGKAVAFNNIGLCALKLNQPEAALSYFRKASKIRKKLSNENLVAHSDLYLAQAYERLNRENKADSLLQRAKDHFKNSDQYDFFRKSVIELAKLEKKKGHYDKALQILKEDYKLQDDTLYGSFEIEEYLLASELKKLMGDYPEAEELAEKGIRKAKEHNQVIQARNLYEELLDLCHRQNNLSKALVISNEIIQLQDSIEESRNNALFEILRTQKELTAQESENQELEELNKESMAELKERNTLLLAAIIVISLMLILLVLVFMQSRQIRRSDKRLQEINQRIMAIVDNTNNIILSLNAQGRVRLINRPGQKFYMSILGCKINNGDNFINLLVSEKHKNIWARNIKKGYEGKVWQEVSQVVLENETHYLLKTFSPIINEKGDFQGLVMVGTDFTESRKKSLEIEKKKEELDQANIAKERMLSILAHDLKDSVFSAKSLTDLVLENSEEHTREDMLDYIELLNANFSKTKNLLVGLLDWVKTQTRGMKARLHEFDLNRLARQVEEGMALKVKEKNLVLTNKIPINTMILADEEMIRTVLRNLLGNAVKYTFENSGIITLKCEDNGNYVRIHVCDNGQGISNDDQLRLFEIPGRISTPGTANEQGTGFGLNLCKELLKLHGSKLHVNSQRGEGSDFYFDLAKA